MNETLTTLDAGSLCYECRGNGPEILLVHGFASSLRVWDPLIAALEADYRCWAVDLAGCGGSYCAPDQQITLDEHVDLLLAFVRQRELNLRAVIGHSMGGMLTLKLALAAPHLAERLVLVCPTVTGKYFWGANYLVAAPVVQKLLLMTRPLWDVLQAEAVKPLLMTPHYLTMPVRERIRDDFRRTSWGAAMSAIAGITAENLEPRLPEIQQPTLVIVGEHDDMVPPSEGRLAAHTMPQAVLLEVPRCHHLPLDEAPEQTLGPIQAFLRGS